MYTCACPSGFFGVNCETDRDECNSHPCQNGASCIVSLLTHFLAITIVIKNVSSFSYRTLWMATHVDVCRATQALTVRQTSMSVLTQLCATQGPAMYALSSKPTTCCYPPPPLLPSQNEPGSYSCSCDVAYTGDHCEMEVNECDSSPCGNGGTCIVSEPTNQGAHGQDCPIQHTG